MGRLTDWLTGTPSSSRLEAAATGFQPTGRDQPTSLTSPWQDDSVLQAVTFAGLWPLANVPVTRATVIAIPPVARGRDQICVLPSGLPLLARNAQGVLVDQPGITEQPEAGRPRSVTMCWTIDSLLFHGVAWWLVTNRNPIDNRPRQVLWVPPWEAEVSNGQLVQAFGQPVDQAQVIRFDGPHEGILRRSGPLWARIHRVNRSADRQADNPVPSVELHQTTGTPMTKPEIDELIEIWAAARRGENGGVGYTNSAIELRTHGLPPEQLLTDLSTKLDLDAARAMGLPAWAVDATPGGSNLTYSNPWGRARELIDGTLNGYLRAISDRLSMDDVLARGTWCTFDTDPLTDGDFAARMAAYGVAITNGIYTKEDLIRREAGIPMEGDQNL